MRFRWLLCFIFVVVCVLAAQTQKVSLTQTGSLEVRKGEIAWFELMVKNGTSVADGVVVRSRVPRGFRFRYIWGPVILKWNMGTLAPGQEKKIAFWLKTTDLSSEEGFAVIARVYLQGKVVHEVDHRVKVVAPKLRLEKKGPRLLYLYRSGTYTIKVINEGNAPAMDLVLTDTLPEHLDFISASPRGRYKPEYSGKLATITWVLTAIAPESTKEFKLEVRAKKGGQCINMVKLIPQSQLPPKLPTLSTEAVTKILGGCGRLHMSTYDTEDPCEIGRQTIYVIEIRNEGTTPYTNVFFKDDIPKEMEFIEAEGPTGHKYDKSKRQVVFEPFPILQPGDKITYRIRCKAIKKGSAKNTARMKYGQFDQEILDEEGTSVYE